MFKNPPKIFAHSSALKNGNFVVEDGIILKDNEQYSLKSRECPHRGYIMHTPGEIVKNVVCKLHGFAWGSDGKPLSKEPYCDHFYKLANHGNLTLGRTGLIFENFNDQDNVEWMEALSKETDLDFVRTIRGESKGSWLWMMEQLTDLLHIRQDGIHPRLSLETPLNEENFNLSMGENYAVQKYTNINGVSGYWIFVYPGFDIEFEPGKLMINRIIPKDKNQEFGFDWEIQLYYAPWVDSIERAEWEKAIEVIYEDMAAIENIKRPFFPLKRMVNDWERQSKHWGEWFLENKIKC
jgi:phenylpropionate dioxygenase-like ring-hydroxylating dioxygenase large terminal subunit